MQHNPIPADHTPPIHFGKLFDNYLSRRRTHKAAVARLIGKTFRMIMYYRRSQSLQSRTIETLSHVLHHNFFLDMAAQLPAYYTTAVVPDTSDKDEIAALRQENMILRAEKEVLMAVAKR